MVLFRAQTAGRTVIKRFQRPPDKFCGAFAVNAVLGCLYFGIRLISGGKFKHHGRRVRKTEHLPGDKIIFLCQFSYFRGIRVLSFSRRELSEHRVHLFLVCRKAVRVSRILGNFQRFFLAPVPFHDFGKFF